MKLVAITQEEAFRGAQLFVRTEGVIPAPETSHAVAVAISEALKAKEQGEEKAIVFNHSGMASGSGGLRACPEAIAPPFSSISDSVR